MSELIRKCGDSISKVHVYSMISPFIGNILYIIRNIDIIKVCISHLPLELLANLVKIIILHNVCICLSKITHWRSIFGINMKSLGRTLFYRVATRHFNWNYPMRRFDNWINLERMISFMKFYPMRKCLSLITNWETRWDTDSLFLLFSVISVTPWEIFWSENSCWTLYTQLNLISLSDNRGNIWDILDICGFWGCDLVHQNFYSIRSFKSPHKCVRFTVWKRAFIPSVSLIEKAMMITDTLLFICGRICTIRIITWVPGSIIFGVNSNIKIVSSFRN